MNIVTLMGRLVRDVDLRMTANNMAVAKFTIAVDRKFKREGDPTADFFNCTAFGKPAEVISKYFAKGKMIAISGRVQNESYTSKDGNKVTATGIIVEGFYFCGDKSSNNNINAAQTQQDSFADIERVTNDDLPF